MAIQNFISGGFYGKVGDVVGQRWHNKRTIRSYVIPANPQTPPQQANRMLFAHATRLAQIAFKVNKGHPSWDTSQTGEFSLRVQEALRRLKLGMSDNDSIPLFPPGYQSSVNLDGGSFSYVMGVDPYLITTTGPVMPTDRTFKVMIYCFDEWENEWAERIEETTIPAGSVFSFSFRSVNRYTMRANSQVQAVTSDDSLFGGTGFFLPPIPAVYTSSIGLIDNITWLENQLDMPTRRIRLFPQCNLIKRSWSIRATFRLTPNSGGSYENVDILGNYDPALKYISFQIPNTHDVYLTNQQLQAGSYNHNLPGVYFAFSWPYRNL